ncbi:hypothetical protein LTS18_001381, partial [Coniosporium uncinatum]
GVGPIGDVVVRGVKVWQGALGRTPARIKGLSESVGVGSVRLEGIRVTDIGRTAETLGEMGVTDVGFAGEIAVVP